MQPITSYTEVRFEGSRIFTLFPDKIIVRGKQSLQSEFEMSIPLKSLNPSPDRLRFRNQIFTGGMWLAIVGFIGSSILVSGFHISFGSLPFGLLAGIGMAGAMLMLATFRKVEFFRFKNDGGIVILDIARAGKNAAELDPFIATLTKQINEARSAA